MAVEKPKQTTERTVILLKKGMSWETTVIKRFLISKRKDIHTLTTVNNKPKN